MTAQGAGAPPARRTGNESVFARRVAGVFATRVLQFGSTIAVAFLLARLLGPEGRGAYSLLLLLPSTLFALAQFGLPSAVTYYAGSGRSLPSLMRHALRRWAIACVGSSVSTVGEIAISRNSGAACGSHSNGSTRTAWDSEARSQPASSGTT